MNHETRHHCICGRDHTVFIAQARAMAFFLEKLGLEVEASKLPWEEWEKHRVDGEIYERAAYKEQYEIKAINERGETILNLSQMN